MDMDTRAAMHQRLRRYGHCTLASAGALEQSRAQAKADRAAEAEEMAQFDVQLQTRKA